MGMRFRQITLMVATLPAWCALASGQTSPAPQDNPPAPAYGQATPSVMSAENPPVSALDAASLEPNLQPRSMLVGGLVGSESLDTNVNQDQGDTSVHSVTRLSGRGDLAETVEPLQFCSRLCGWGRHLSERPADRTEPPGVAGAAIGGLEDRASVDSRFVQLLAGR